MNLFFPKPPRAPLASLGRRVRQLELTTARLIRDGFAGQYHAAFHGKGIEFAQVREYQPGDDIRTIDWNVTARSGVPHVKQFVEERDLTLVIALDLSASMEFGSLYRRKIELATELVAVLAFAAWNNGDRVGLVAFRDAVTAFVPPRRGTKHVRALVRRALAMSGESRGVANFAGVATFLQRVIRKPSVMVVISDFLGAEAEMPLKRLARRHDVLALRLHDPRELQLPRQGLLTLIDPETGLSRRVDLRSRDLMREAEERRLASTRMLRRSGVDFVDLSTTAAYDRPLVSFFETRTRRR